MLLIFPEVFAGHESRGPVSPWSAREVRDLEGKGDVRRGSAFLSQLAGTEQKRPVGIRTNLPQVQSKLFLHWSCLITCGDELHYNGPLPLFLPMCSTARPFQVNGRAGGLRVLLFPITGQAVLEVLCCWCH